MEELLRILEKNARMPIEDIAAMLDKTPEEIAAMMDEAAAKGYIRGYETLVDWEQAGVNLVEAVIELRVTPHKARGFDDIGMTIAQFDEVDTVLLMSGSYDLQVIIKGRSFQEIAIFVAKRLSPLDDVLVVSMISLFGTVHISANAVANNLDAIGCIVGNAMGLAMITVIGRCIGAQDFEQTNYYTKKLLLWDYIAQGAVNVVVLLSLNQILSMYTLTPETRALAWTLVMIHNGMSIFLWPASFVLPNALRAANDVRFTMVVATASMLVWRMGLSWVLCVQMGMGAVGVWYAMVVDWICRIICFVARFVSGAWKKNAVKQAA